jgi:putative tricarboxylic transport membrane protein
MFARAGGGRAAFGPADYFAMMLLGLVAAATLAQGSPIKGIAMVLSAWLLGLVGTDVQTGQQRFTFGIPNCRTASAWSRSPWACSASPR